MVYLQAKGPGKVDKCLLSRDGSVLIKITSRCHGRGELGGRMRLRVGCGGGKWSQILEAICGTL
jgi:hypothetical protein